MSGLRATIVETGGCGAVRLSVERAVEFPLGLEFIWAAEDGKGISLKIVER